MQTEAQLDLKWGAIPAGIGWLAGLWYANTQELLDLHTQSWLIAVLLGTFCVAAVGGLLGLIAGISRTVVRARSLHPVLGLAATAVGFFLARWAVSTAHTIGL